MQDAHAAGSPHCRLLQEHTHRKAMFQQTRMQHLLAAQTWNRHAHPTCTGQSTPKMKRNQQPRDMHRPVNTIHYKNEAQSAATRATHSMYPMSCGLSKT
jgi:hypothetical protein